MLFSEQVRIIKDEETLVNDTSTYDKDAVTDWLTMVTKSFTLASQKLVIIKYEFWLSAYNAPNPSNANSRILLDNVPILSSGSYESTGSLALKDTPVIFVLLNAGSHTVDFQLSVHRIYSASYEARITNIWIGTLNFPDRDEKSYDSGSVSCPATSTTTLINQNFTTPAARKLAVGSIKKYVAIITLYAWDAYQRINKLKNVGDSDDASRFNWKILIDDNQKSWSERKDDYDTSSNPTYGVGAYGRLIIPLDPATQYNLKINVYNGFGSAYDGRAVVEVTICPWIIAYSEYEPITLDFPQGSTFYIVTEPLFENPTKAIKIGKKRSISFGDITDYYSTASGTNILSHNYTFDMIGVANSVLLVSGWGGCVSVLAVDVR